MLVQVGVFVHPFPALLICFSLQDCCEIPIARALAEQLVLVITLFVCDFNTEHHFGQSVAMQDLRLSDLMLMISMMVADLVDVFAQLHQSSLLELLVLWLKTLRLLVPIRLSIHFFKFRN